MAVTESGGRLNFTATGNSVEEPSESILVKGLNWFGAADGNTLIVDDQDDVEIFGWKAETGALSKSFVFPKPIPVSQVKVTMTAGTLVVYI